MTTRVFLVFALSAAVFGGCGDDGSPPDFPDGSTTDARVNDASQTTPDAGQAADASMNPDGPDITVLSPTDPGSDLSSDAIVTSERFSVRCRVVEDMAPVDPGSVMVTAIVDGVERTSSAAATLVANEYQGDILATGLGNGAMQVRCTAADTEGRTDSASVSTYLDLGPTVQMLSPVADTSYAQQVAVAFKVVSAPVASPDPGGDADFDNVSAAIGGVVVTDLLTHDGNGTFTGNVPFDDPRFEPVLDGPQTVTVRAPNMRSTVATVRKQITPFTADAKGPTIVVNTPQPGALLAGIVSFEAIITDTAGVDPDSVVGTVAGVNEFQLTSTGGDTYVGNFDTRELGVGIIYPNVIIRAKDLVGNQSSTGYVVALDNRPPLASLDPPLVRERKISDLQNAFECSELFDPVGNDAASDGETVPQVFRLNVRAEDRGNSALANPGTVLPIGDVDENNVKLYVLDDSSRALIVDTNGDGICDAINPLITPTSVPMASNEAALINLGRLTERGGYFYRLPPPTQPDFDRPFYFNASPEANGGCEIGAPFDEVQIVPPACDQSADRRIMELEHTDQSAIWGIPPISENVCWGNPFDALGKNISDGWACLAVEVSDTLGNVGISPPMRLCIDHDGDRRDDAGNDLHSVHGCGDSNARRPQQVGPVTVGGTPSAIAAGGSHTCALSGNSVRCWGEAGSGQLGYGNTNDIGDNETPDSVTPVITNAIAIAAGDEHTCVITTSNTVACWGNGANGRLGYGNTSTIGDDEQASTTTPVDLGGATVNQLAVGGRHTCARSGTQVYCWGDNSSGQLGYGNTNDIGDNEAAVSAGTVNVGFNVAQIVAGGAHTCALSTGGDVKCWGDNTYGQLGRGDTLTIGDDELPNSVGNVNVVPMGDSRTVVELTAGDSHTCARLDDGNVRCWGNGADGRLGYGTEEHVGDDEEPWILGNVLISPNPIVEIAAGRDHTCARDTLGVAYCWGLGRDDQLGYGRQFRVGHGGAPAAARFVDTVEMGVTVTRLAPGGRHTCVLRSDNSVLCWGADSSGQVGHADKGDSLTDIGDVAPVWKRPNCTGTYDPATNTTDSNTPCRIPESFQDDPRWQLRRSDVP